MSSITYKSQDGGEFGKITFSKKCGNVEKYIILNNVVSLRQLLVLNGNVRLVKFAYEHAFTIIQCGKLENGYHSV